MNSTEKDQNQIYYGGHLVAFIDMLGQSAQLHKFRDIEWWKLDNDTKCILRETYGKVLTFRRTINDFLKSFSQPSPMDVALKELEEAEHSDFWNHFDESRILSKALSDSLILTFPLEIKNGLIPLKSIYGVLGACASSMLVSLNCKFAIRGAIEIGPCIFDTSSEEVYGSALNDAVKYEKLADWPRIIIGPELIKYLKGCTQIPENSPIDQFNVITAKRCLSILAEDETGNYFLDFLGSALEEFHNLPSSKQIIEGAESFIDSQLKEFQHDDKIRIKYEKLKTYFTNSIK